MIKLKKNRVKKQQNINLRVNMHDSIKKLLLEKNIFSNNRIYGVFEESQCKNRVHILRVCKTKQHRRAQ